MFADTLPFASQYVSALAEELSRRHPEHPLSRLQQGWLSYCLTGLLLTGSLNWSAFERMGLGRYRIGARSWMFRRAQLLWSELLQASVSLLLRMFQIKHGILVVDDTDHRRAKKTTRIISQLHVDQLVLFQNKEMSVQDYFAKHPGTLQAVPLRGGESVQMWVSSARLKIKTLGTKRFVIAVRRADEAQ